MAVSVQGPTENDDENLGGDSSVGGEQPGEGRGDDLRTDAGDLWTPRMYDSCRFAPVGPKFVTNSPHFDPECPRSISLPGYHDRTFSNSS